MTLTIPQHHARRAAMREKKRHAAIAAICFALAIALSFLLAGTMSAQVASIAVSFGSNTIATGNTTQATARGRTSSGGSTSISCAWSVLGPAVSISASGLVTGSVPGTANVVCRSGAIIGGKDIRDTARSVVIPPPVVTAPGTPGTPAFSVTTAGTTTSMVRVAWTKSLNATSYGYRSGLNGGPAWSGASGATTTQNVSLANVPNGASIWFGVWGINAAGRGDSAYNAFTVPGSVITPPPVDTTPKPPVDTTTPPPIVGSPVPGPTDQIIWQDNFDGANPLASYAKAGSISIITNGAGHAARFSYSPGNDDNLIEKGFTATTDFWVSYRYRISAGWLPYGGRTGSGMKWFMPWRAGSDPRYTCGVGQLTTPNWLFTCHDNSSTRQPNPFKQNKALTPAFNTTNNGQWHTYALHIVTGNAGYEQIWIDGVLVLDDSGLGYDHSAGGIGLFQFPGLVVDGIPDAAHSGTIDIDDLIVWRKP